MPLQTGLGRRVRHLAHVALLSHYGAQRHYGATRAVCEEAARHGSYEEEAGGEIVREGGVDVIVAQPRYQPVVTRPVRVDQYGHGAQLAVYAADGGGDLLAAGDVALIARACRTVDLAVLSGGCAVAEVVDIGCGVGCPLLTAAQVWQCELRAE